MAGLLCSWEVTIPKTLSESLRARTSPQSKHLYLCDGYIYLFTFFRILSLIKPICRMWYHKLTDVCRLYIPWIKQKSDHPWNNAMPCMQITSVQITLTWSHKTCQKVSHETSRCVLHFSPSTIYSAEQSSSPSSTYVHSGQRLQDHAHCSPSTNRGLTEDTSHNDGLCCVGNWLPMLSDWYYNILNTDMHWQMWEEKNMPSHTNWAISDEMSPYLCISQESTSCHWSTDEARKASLKQ